MKSITSPFGGRRGFANQWPVVAGLIFARKARIQMGSLRHRRRLSIVPVVQRAGLRGYTIAFGPNVPGVAGHCRVLQIIRATGGFAIAVRDQDIAAELKPDWQRTHGWVSPEGAACLAALPQLLDRGFVKRGERVVAVNTGSLEKYLPDVRKLL